MREIVVLKLAAVLAFACRLKKDLGHGGGNGFNGRLDEAVAQGDRLMGQILA